MIIGLQTAKFFQIMMWSKLILLRKEEQTGIRLNLTGEADHHQVHHQEQAVYSMAMAKKILSNGDVYEGDWANRAPNGRGKMIEGGTVKEGRFENGEFVG